MTVGLITRDASGNVLLDTTTVMFRILDLITVPVCYVDNGVHNLTGSVTNPGLALGEAFAFVRNNSFRNRYNVGDTLLVTQSGTTLSWEWQIAETSPASVDMFYGVKS